MKASETHLRNLLGNNNIQFQIPLFQRPYSWKQENWEVLWEDLMRIYRDEITGSYFLGSLVTQSLPGSADGICPFLIIDGQQRLTTLTIILASLKGYLQKSKKLEDKRLAEELYECYLVNKFQEKEDHYKLLPTQDDREVYQLIVTGKLSSNSKKQVKDKNIYKAYDFFNKSLKKLPFDFKEEQSTNFKKIKNIILEQLIVVNITSEDKDNPYLIFESLNNKGQELTQADLVRNYLFMKLPTNQQASVYKEKWLPIETTFKDKSKKEEKYSESITDFLWFYLRKDGKSITKKEVYQKIKAQIDLENNNLENKINEIIKFARYYQCIIFNDLEQENILKNYFNRFKILDFSTCHIFLLNVYDDYEKGKISLEQFEQILNYLESYFVRRWFADVPTNILGKVFDNLYNEVKQNQPDNLVKGLHHVLSSYSANKSWPKDNVFRKGIIEKSIYKKNDAPRVKFVLESLEKSLNKKEEVNTGNLTVEHIMPQTLTSEWKSSLGKDYQTIKSRWLNTLSNLTLTGYNSELSNKTFNTKKKIYQESNVSLNKYFQNVDVWNEDSIKKRAEKLADIAVKIWQR